MKRGIVKIIDAYIIEYCLALNLHEMDQLKMYDIRQGNTISERKKKTPHSSSYMEFS